MYKLIGCRNFYILDQSNKGKIFNGNKFIKNKYLLKNKKKLISMGSKYSNHCLSLAYYCKKMRTKFIYLLVSHDPNKEKNIEKYPNIKIAKKMGAKIIYINGVKIHKKIDYYKNMYSNYLWVPSGGHNQEALEECAKYAKNFIRKNMDLIKKLKWILVAVGTGTTLLGFLSAVIELKLDVKLIGISVSRKKKNILESAYKFFNKKELNRVQIVDDYHGMYGKILRNDSQYQLKFFEESNLKIDPIYNIRAISYIYKKKLKDGLYVNTGGSSNNL
jgi:1-aminocyclopropane-1-carboxylate deaminase/D-cysteine desulfhydrase-like pyridoxal-dependent ACC family enzyme